MKNYLKHLQSDFPASIVVYLVALPLCLGIALGSTAPLFAGIIAGVIGGLVVGFLSGSPLSVSGPAAGLTSIVAEIRAQAVVSLNKLSRQGSLVRVRNRCVLTGRSRGILRKWRLSRIQFRELAAQGRLLGVSKSSW